MRARLLVSKAVVCCIVVAGCPLKQQSCQTTKNEVDATNFIQLSFQSHVYQDAFGSLPLGWLSSDSQAQSKGDVAVGLRAQMQNSALPDSQTALEKTFLPPWPRIRMPRMPASSADQWNRFDTVLMISLGIAILLFDVYYGATIEHSLCNNTIMFLLMLLVSASFLAMVWLQRGSPDGSVWAIGYSLEWAFCIDNLFLFNLLFGVFSVPKSQSRFAMTVGIYGAFLFRFGLILGLTAMFRLHVSVGIFVGSILVVFGVWVMHADDGGQEVQDLCLVRWLKWLLGPRFQDTSTDDVALFSRNESGNLQVTVLFLVVCVIAVVDPIFSLDCIAYKTHEIKNVFINVSSTWMGMFSLRALFFIIRDLSECFEYMRYAMCVILLGTGIEMIASNWVEVSLVAMTAGIVAVLAIAMLASCVKVVFYERGKAQKLSLPQDDIGKPSPDLAPPETTMDTTRA